MEHTEPEPPRSRPGLAYLLAAEGRRQENLLRIAAARLNRLLDESWPEAGASTLAVWGETEYWERRIEFHHGIAAGKRRGNPWI